jgi:hypothetical protein
MNKFWPDIFVGVASFTLMQTAVTGKFRSGGSRWRTRYCYIQLILPTDHSCGSRLVLICVGFEGCP